MQAVAWGVWLLDTIWRPVLLAVAVVGVVGVWEIGRRSGALPRWATPEHSRVDATVVITPGGIATALAHLGIPALNRAVKDGWQVEFHTPPVRVNRRGYQTVFSLPDGGDGGDDRRQTRRAGPQPRSEPRWRCGPRPPITPATSICGWPIPAPPNAPHPPTHCCTTGEPMCSTVSRSGCRNAAT